MKKLCYLLIFLMGNYLMAQNDFVKGYYVSVAGDTVYGYVKDMDWLLNPGQVRFKKTLDSDVEVYRFNDVIEFGDDLKQFKYIKQTVGIDMSPHLLEELSANRTPVIEEQTVFLKVLLEGDASLYYFYYRGGNKFFFNTSQSPEIRQLIYKQYKVSYDKVAKNLQYQQQIRTYLTCSAITDAKIKATRYLDKEMIKLFETYNKCKEADYVVYKNMKEKRKGAFHIYAKAGVNSTSVKFKPDHRDFVVDLGTKVNVSLGAEFEYIFPFNNRKWSLFVNPAYIQFKGETMREYNYVEAYDMYYELKYSFLEVPIGGRHYFFLNENAKLYVDASFVVNFDIDSYIISSREGLGSGKGDIVNKENFAFGLGYRYKKFGIEAKYFTPKTMGRGIVDNDSQLKNYALTLVYTIL